jgi:predicted CoA-binding protein
MKTTTVAKPAPEKPAAGKVFPAPAETAHDILHQRAHPLDVFFEPKSVAVIGATETAGSVGRTILWNLVSSPFGGTVFPVNPKRASVLGIKAYPQIGAVPESVDLAVVVTPAPTVPGIIGECLPASVRNFLDPERRNGGHPSSHPSGRRAADGAVPRQAVRPNGLLPLFRRPETKPARGA